MLGSDRVEFPPASQEVMIEQPDDMETIGYDHGIRKMLSGDGAVHGGQVHANHANLVFAFQSIEIGVQGQFRATENDIVDLVVLQVAKGGRIAFAACEEMLIHTEHQRAARRMPLSELPLQPVLKVALDRSRSDPFSPAQPAAVDSIQVQFIDGLPKSFTGFLTGQDSRKAIPVVAPASFAQPLA